MRRSAGVPLHLLAAAAVAVPSADARNRHPAHAPLKPGITSAAALASTIDRGGFGFNLDGWPFLLVMGVGAVVLLARSGGE